jgi:hypothetical protein
MRAVILSLPKGRLRLAPDHSPFRESSGLFGLTRTFGLKQQHVTSRPPFLYHRVLSRTSDHFVAYIAQIVR